MLFGSLDIQTSALVAQRTRMQVISANMANKNSIVNSNGEYSPFRRRIAVFGHGDPANGNDKGVHVQEIAMDMSPFRKKHEPGNEFADEDGFVEYPNIDPSIEMISALEASRAYEANITAAEATKSMIQTSLRLIA